MRVQIMAHVEPYVFAAIGDHLRTLVAGTGVAIGVSAIALDSVYSRPGGSRSTRADGAASADAQTCRRPAPRTRLAAHALA